MQEPWSLLKVPSLPAAQAQARVYISAWQTTAALPAPITIPHHHLASETPWQWNDEELVGYNGLDVRTYRLKDQEHIERLKQFLAERPHWGLSFHGRYPYNPWENKADAESPRTALERFRAGVNDDLRLAHAIDPQDRAPINYDTGIVLDFYRLEGFKRTAERFPALHAHAAAMTYAALGVRDRETWAKRVIEIVLDERHSFGFDSRPLAFEAPGAAWDDGVSFTTLMRLVAETREQNVWLTADLGHLAQMNALYPLAVNPGLARRMLYIHVSDPIFWRLNGTAMEQVAYPLADHLDVSRDFVEEMLRRSDGHQPVADNAILSLLTELVRMNPNLIVVSEIKAPVFWGCEAEPENRALLRPLVVLQTCAVRSAT